MNNEQTPKSKRETDNETVDLPSRGDQATMPPSSGEDDTFVIDGGLLPAGYELIERLGEGGMGRVFKARHVKLNRVVALKELLPGSQSEKAKGRFGAEAEAIALLQHPNVIEVFDFGEHEGRPYLALEFCGGGTLAEKIKRERPSLKEGARIVEILAGAIQAAHQVRVIHRDLKPANVLLTDTGELKVTDFGLAKRQDVAMNTAAGDILGTPSYMAPEQAGANDRVSAATDVYGLGAILYELLTGRPPFQGENQYDIIMKAVSEVLESPRRINPQVPRDLETICMKCLEKDPGKRYQSAEELAEELERYREDRPILARPLGPTGRAWRWGKRYPAVAGLGTAVAVVLIAGVIVSLFYAVKASKQAARAEQNQIVADRNAAAAKVSEEEAIRVAKELVKTVESERVAKKEALWNLYVAKLFPMKAAWEARDFGQLEYLLEQSTPKNDEPDFRGWEWYYFQDQVQKASRVLEGSSATSGQVACCRQTGQIAVGNKDGTIDIWDKTGTTLAKTLSKHPGSCNELSWSGDGTRLSCAGSYWVTCWDVLSGERIAHIRVSDGDAKSATWSPDDKSIATGGSAGIIEIYDVATGKLLRTMTANTEKSTHRLYRTTWEPNGQLLATGHRYGLVRVWDTPTGRLLWSGQVTQFGGDVPAVAWSPDGNKLVAGKDNGVIIWDKDGNKLSTLTNDRSMATCLEWSPDGQRIVVGNVDQSISVWDAVSGERTTTKLIHSAPLTSVAWDIKGTTILSASPSSVRVSSVSSQPKALKLQISSTVPVKDIVWGLHDNSLWCVVNDLTVRWYDRSGQLTRILRDPYAQSGFVGLAIHPDGSQIASKTYWGKCIVWDVATGKPIQVYHPPSDSDQGGNDMAWSPDGQHLAMLFHQRVYLVETTPWSSLERLDPLTENDWCVAWSPDSSQLAVGGYQHMRLWDVSTRTKRFPAPCEGFVRNAITCSPDGQFIVVGNDAGVLIWFRAADGERIRSIQAHKSPIVDIRWNPNARRMASIDVAGTLKIWDTATGMELVSLSSDGSKFNTMKWSTDGKQIACTSDDGSIYFWGSPDMGVAAESATHLETGLLASVKAPAELLALEETKLTLAIQADPHNFKGYEDRGRFYCQHQRWADAAKDFEQAAEINPTSLWSLYQAADAQLMLGQDEAQTRLVQTLLDESFSQEMSAEGWSRVIRVCSWTLANVKVYPLLLDHATQAAKEKSNNCWITYTPALPLYRLGRYEEARKVLQAAAKLKTDELQRAMITLWLAMTQYRLGDVDQARTTLAEAVQTFHSQLPPKGQPLHRYAYRDFMEYQLVVREAKLLILGSKDAEVPELKGPTLTPAEQFQQALAQTDGPVSQTMLAQIHLFNDFAPDARECLKDAVQQLDQLAGTYPEQVSLLRLHRGKANTLLGDIYLAEGEYEQAEKAYRRALEKSSLVSTYLGLGKALTALGRHDEALLEFRLLLKSKSQTAVSLNNYAWQLVTDPNPKFHNGPAAVEMVRKSIELDPKNVTFTNTLGVALYRVGKWKESITALNESTELRKGGDAFDWYFLAMAHHQLGDAEKAKEWFDKAVQWSKVNKPDDEELIRFLKEAEALLKQRPDL